MMHTIDKLTSLSADMSKSPGVRLCELVAALSVVVGFKGEYVLISSYPCLV